MYQKERLLDKFADCTLTISETKQIIGGSSYLNTVIFRILTEKADLNLGIAEDLHHADYRYFAYQIGISLSTLKRFAREGSRLNTHNQTKLFTYLGYASWDDLEKAAIERIQNQE